VDIIGCNFYFNNQWVVGTNEFLPWLNDGNDPRWRSLGALLQEVFERYGRPLVLAETSHPGEHRPSWTGYVSDECCKLLARGFPLWGLCWYPIIDRPDWDRLSVWHHAGVWDVETTDGSLMRRLHAPTAVALHEAQKKIKAAMVDQLADTHVQRSRFV
jgi:hypothetical protein